MYWRLIGWSALGAAVLFVMIGGVWILSLPPAMAVGCSSDYGGRGSSHDCSLEAAQTPATAGRDHRYQCARFTFWKGSQKGRRLGGAPRLVFSGDASGGGFDLL